MKFNHHAKNRMRTNRITEEEVQSVVERPDFTEPTRQGRTNYFGRIDSGLRIRVTAIEENGELVIITVTPMRRGRYR